MYAHLRNICLGCWQEPLQTPPFTYVKTLIMKRGLSDHAVVEVTDSISIAHCGIVAPAKPPGSRPAVLVTSGMQTQQNEKGHLVTCSVSSIILIHTGA